MTRALRAVAPARCPGSAPVQAFEYLAVDARGRDRRGVLEGDTRRQVRQRLRDQGLTPLRVREARAHVGGAPRMGAATLALATRQLATLVASDTAVEEALTAVARQASGRACAPVLMGVRGRVLEGQSLADALAAFPETFSEAYVASVAAGERSGRLGPVLEGLADHLEDRGELRRTVAVALLYPLVLTGVALLVVGAMLAWVVPRVVQVFAGADQALPWLTRAVIGASEIVRDHGLWFLAALVVVVLGLRAGLVIPPWRYRLHALWHRLPLISRLVRAVNAARFAGALALLVGSGVTLVEALRVASLVVSSLPMQRAARDAGQRVAEGESLATSLQRSGLFPPVMIELIASGESAGRLEAVLERAARSQEQDARVMLRTGLALLEPLLTLLMGVLVLIIVMAMLLPLFELNRMVG